LEEVSRDHPHLNHHNNEEDISQTWKDTNSDLEGGAGEEGSGEVHNETESEDNISAVTDNMFLNNFEDNNSVPERAPEKQKVSYNNIEEREEEQEEQCILPVSVHHPFENQEQPHHTTAAHNTNHSVQTNTNKPACQYDLMENYLQHITMNLIKLLIYVKPWESTRDAELEVNVKTKMNSLFSPFRRLLPSFLVEVMQCYVVLNGFFVVGMIFLGLYEMKFAFWLLCLPIKTTLKILNMTVRLVVENGPTGLIKKLAEFVKSIRENGPSVLLR
jgi:hypothetical protein